MKNSRDLILGKVLYIFIIYHIRYSWLYLLNGYYFFGLITWQVKTSNSGIEFPVNKIEKQNQINCNVFGSRREIVVSTWIIKGEMWESDEFSEGKKSHYILIKDFNRFMLNQTKHKEKSGSACTVSNVSRQKIFSISTKMIASRLMELKPSGRQKKIPKRISIMSNMLFLLQFTRISRRWQRKWLLVNQQTTLRLLESTRIMNVALLVTS